MSGGDQRVLRTIVEEAVVAAGATQGWIVVVDDDGAAVAATSEGLADRVGTPVALEGARGLALASGQASALMPGPADTSNTGIAGWDGIPPSLLVAPGGDGRVLLEVAGKVTGGGFVYEDLEALSSLATIAAAAADDAGAVDDVPGPARLAAELAALATADPDRYRDVARIVDSLLSATR